jgi:hypothetical protein
LSVCVIVFNHCTVNITAHMALSGNPSDMYSDGTQF